MSLVGTGVTLSLFYYLLDPYYSSGHDKNSKDYALFNIYITFAAYILSSMSTSAIFYNKIMLQNVNYSVISGWILISIISTVIKNPFVAMVIGVFGGSFTNLFVILYKTVLTSGKKYIFDPTNFIPTIMMPSIIGSFFIVPMVIRSYELD